MSVSTIEGGHCLTFYHLLCYCELWPLAARSPFIMLVSLCRIVISLGRVSNCEIIMSLIGVSLTGVAKIFLHFSHALSCEFLAVLGMRDHTDETVLIVVVLDNTLRILAVPNMLDHTGETVPIVVMNISYKCYLYTLSNVVVVLIIAELTSMQSAELFLIKIVVELISLIISEPSLLSAFVQVLLVDRNAIYLITLTIAKLTLDFKLITIGVIALTTAEISLIPAEITIGMVTLTVAELTIIPAKTATETITLTVGELSLIPAEIAICINTLSITEFSLLLLLGQLLSIVAGVIGVISLITVCEHSLLAALAQALLKERVAEDRIIQTVNWLSLLIAFAQMIAEFTCEVITLTISNLCPSQRVKNFSLTHDSTK